MVATYQDGAIRMAAVVLSLFPLHAGESANDATSDVIMCSQWDIPNIFDHKDTKDTIRAKTKYIELEWVIIIFLLTNL